MNDKINLKKIEIKQHNGRTQIIYDYIPSQNALAYFNTLFFKDFRPSIRKIITSNPEFEKMAILFIDLEFEKLTNRNTSNDAIQKIKRLIYSFSISSNINEVLYALDIAFDSKKGTSINQLKSFFDIDINIRKIVFEILNNFENELFYGLLSLINFCSIDIFDEDNYLPNFKNTNLKRHLEISRSNNFGIDSTIRSMTLDTKIDFLNKLNLNEKDKLFFSTAASFNWIYEDFNRENEFEQAIDYLKKFSNLRNKVYHGEIMIIKNTMLEIKLLSKIQCSEKWFYLLSSNSRHFIGNTIMDQIYNEINKIKNKNTAKNILNLIKNM